MKTVLVNEILKFAEDNNLDLHITRASVRLDRVALAVKTADVATGLFSGCRKNHWPVGVAPPVMAKFWGGDYTVLDGDRVVEAAGMVGFMWVPALIVSVDTFLAITKEFKLSRFGFVAFLAETSKVGENELLVNVHTDEVAA